MKRIYKNILKNGLVSKFISFLVCLYLYIVYFTSKKSFCYHEDSHNAIHLNSHGVLIAFWHNRLALIPFIAPQSPQISVYILHSGHRDGTIIKNIMHLFNFKTISGSSKKGGFQALKDILSTMKKNTAIAIVPDGPRGPRYQINGNIVQIAAKTRAPIVPVSCQCTRKKIFNSWDRFILPLPFNNLTFIFGSPIKVVSNPSEADINNTNLLLKQSLDLISNDKI